MIVNPQRGEVPIVINGSEYAMRLTLGALASLEDRVEAKSLVSLVERFESGGFTSNDLILLLWAGLNGAGTLMSIEDVAASNVEGGPVVAAKAASQLLFATFGSEPS